MIITINMIPWLNFCILFFLFFFSPKNWLTWNSLWNFGTTERSVEDLMDDDRLCRYEKFICYYYYVAVINIVCYCYFFLTFFFFKKRFKHTYLYLWSCISVPFEVAVLRLNNICWSVNIKKKVWFIFIIALLCWIRRVLFLLANLVMRWR